ncbi:uncharacterized protein [Pocillopora verrucosa]|uniref:uncharacterized protein LOC113673157 isoform X1 n=1 Tax=Pocillopora damicornis TaxID=46731 RepID=UPI000F550991|nr:uncharacterized protein LOC113673157 isoform X1 [Pocillopora damicornis]XP_058971431.1 uncharacterized protein LOC131797793 isoform X2 [Pocillopora verrucosa]
MVIKTFLCCFSIYEGSWVCGLCSLFIGTARVYLEEFNLKFRQRMTLDTRNQLRINFKTLQLITILQLSVAAVSILVSLLMMFGLLKRLKWLLCPWLVWVLIEELSSIFVIIFYALSDVKLKCSVYISEAITLVIAVYFMMCVFSYFKFLRQQDIITDQYHAAAQLNYEQRVDEESPVLSRPI